MVEANRLLYKPPVPGAKGKAAKGEHPDHIVVIKYVPAVGDSKKAIDEHYILRDLFQRQADHQHF